MTQSAAEWTLSPADRASAHLDPLLACLGILARHHQSTVSEGAMVAGLPLKGDLLTPELAPRAAARAGLSARLVRIGLDKIDPALLPCILLLEHRQAAVLVGLEGGQARLIRPETGQGEIAMELEALRAAYRGHALFCKPEVERGPDTATAPRGGHWFWSVIWSLWPSWAEVILSAGLVNILALASPLFIMNIYDRVLPNQAEVTLWVLAVGMAVALTFDFLLRSLRAALIDTAGRRADILLAARLFQQVMTIAMKARPASTGAFAAHLREFESVRDFFTSATLTALTDLMFVGLFIAVISVVAGPLAWIPSVVAVAVLLLALLIQRPLSRAVTESQALGARKHGLLVEAVSGLDTIRALGAEGRMQRQWELAVGATARSAQRSRFWSTLGVNMTLLSQQMVSVLIVVAGVMLAARHEITQGGIIAAVILGGRAVGPLANIANTLVRAHQSWQAYRTLDKIMALPVERPETSHLISRAVTGQVQFRDVSFSYPASDAPALRGISIDVAPGEKVGIVGRVGSGKTTLGRLLINLYDPDEGAVLLDGVDLRQYHPADIRRAVGFVMQDVMLFDGTIRDNIALALPGADDALVLRAAQLAGVDEFVSEHPRGYGLRVGERGQNLSGGQRQAVALARALLLDPPILMLDEPTSAMDNAAETAFIRRIASATRGSERTLIVTTHRLSLLRLVDRLIVLDKGKMLMDGPRDQVLKKLAQPADPSGRDEEGGP